MIDDVPTALTVRNLAGFVLTLSNMLRQNLRISGFGFIFVLILTFGRLTCVDVMEGENALETLENCFYCGWKRVRNLALTFSQYMGGQSNKYLDALDSWW